MSGRRSQSRLCPAVRASKSIERVAVVFREQNGVCCWRFVRLERQAAATKPKKTTRRVRVAPPSSSHLRRSLDILSVSFLLLGSDYSLPPGRSTWFLLSRSSDSLPPDLFLFYTRCGRSVPLSCVPIVPPDFFHRGTDREVIYRACSWLLELLSDLAFWDWCCDKRGERNMKDEWCKAKWLVCVCVIVRSFRLLYSLITSCTWSTRLFANF